MLCASQQFYHGGGGGRTEGEGGLELIFKMLPCRGGGKIKKWLSKIKRRIWDKRKNWESLIRVFCETFFGLFCYQNERKRERLSPASQSLCVCYLMKERGLARMFSRSVDPGDLSTLFPPIMLGFFSISVKCTSLPCDRTVMLPV